jgi:hypothetical protein
MRVSFACLPCAICITAVGCLSKAGTIDITSSTWLHQLVQQTLWLLLFLLLLLLLYCQAAWKMASRTVAMMVTAVVILFAT